MFQLTGKVALVTGASRGIGGAIARRLAAQGALVVAAARADHAAQTATDIQAAGGRAEAVALDVTDVEAVETVPAEIARRHGRLDIVVSNAGITRDQLLLRMKREDWDAVLDTNLRAVWLLSRKVIRPMMKARWGRIINITSVVGASGNPGQANYAAAKAGVVGMTKSLARELGSRNITVNCVAPGFIDTDMARALSDDQKKALLEHIPLGRLGTPQDVAAAVAYLASPGGGYVTGAVLHVNGGMYMS